jgi:hypothetical protein
VIHPFQGWRGDSFLNDSAIRTILVDIAPLGQKKGSFFNKHYSSRDKI